VRARVACIATTTTTTGTTATALGYGHSSSPNQSHSQHRSGKIQQTDSRVAGGSGKPYGSGWVENLLTLRHLPKAAFQLENQRLLLNGQVGGMEALASSPAAPMHHHPPQEKERVTMTQKNNSLHLWKRRTLVLPSLLPRRKHHRHQLQTLRLTLLITTAVILPNR